LPLRHITRYAFISNSRHYAIDAITPRATLLVIDWLPLLLLFIIEEPDIATITFATLADRPLSPLSLRHAFAAQRQTLMPPPALPP